MSQKKNNADSKKGQRVVKTKQRNTQQKMDINLILFIRGVAS